MESFLVFTSVRFTVDFSTLETSFEIGLGVISAIGGRCPSNLLTTGLNLISQELIDLGLIGSSLWYLNL